MHDIEKVEVDGSAIRLHRRGHAEPHTIACAVNDVVAREIGEALAARYRVPLQDGSRFPLSLSPL